MEARGASAADSRRDARVAVVLAVATLVTAVVGTRATMLLGDASGSWEREGKQSLDRASFTTRFGIAAYAAGETWLDLRRIRAETSELQRAGSFLAVPELRRDANAIRATEPDKSELEEMSADTGQSPSAYTPRQAMSFLNSLFARAHDQPGALDRSGNSASTSAVRFAAVAAVSGLAFLLAGLAGVVRRGRGVLLAAASLILLASIAAAVGVEIAG